MTRILVVDNADIIGYAESYFTAYQIDFIGGDPARFEGKEILLWPSADTDSVRAMRKFGVTIKADSIKIIEPRGVNGGWNISTALNEGWDSPRLIAWAKERVSELKLASDIPRGALKRGTPAAPHTAIEDGSAPAASVLAQQLDLQTNGRLVPAPNLNNAIRIISGVSSISEHIWWDEFLVRIRTNWRGPERNWGDADDIKLTIHIQSMVDIRDMSDGTIRKAITAYAQERSRNCARDWVRATRWDGIERLPTLLSDAFGTPQDAYYAAVGRCWLVSMAARIMRPGCQVDYMPVFEGSQGGGKTSALRILGGPWFGELHESIGTKDFFQSLEGILIAEFSELHAFKRQEIERIKGIITSTNDRYRQSYGYRVEDHPRRCVFAGTTNRDDWNGDDTGARRFWPVKCGEINNEYLAVNRDQLFAEALHRFFQNESWWDVPRELAEGHQAARRAEDPWSEAIENWISGRLECSISDIFNFCLELDVTRQDMISQKRVGAILKTMGWYKVVKRVEGILRKRWVTPKDRVTQETLI